MRKAFILCGLVTLVGVISSAAATAANDVRAERLMRKEKQFRPCSRSRKTKR
jgi:hypothetical protein